MRIGLDDIPHDGLVNVKVAMNEPVPHGGDSLPFNMANMAVAEGEGFVPEAA